MADMDLGLDLDLNMEGEENMEIESLSVEEQKAMEAEDIKPALAHDLEGFARGFAAAWDLEPPAELLKTK